MTYTNGVYNVWLWTIDDPETMQKLVDLKVDGIITNKPDLLVD